MIIDIIVLVILLISAGIAFMRGFIREVLTIAGVVGGLASAYFCGPLLKPHMRGWFGVEEGVVPERLFGIIPYDLLADVLSYGLIFIVVVTVLSFISHTLAEWARSAGLGAVDRSLGFLFGLVRGILLVGFLYLPVHLFIEQDAKDSWFENTRSQFYMEKVAATMAGYLPEGAKEGAEESLAAGEEIMDAREALENSGVLKKEEPDSETAPSQEQPRDSGYSDSFRDGMDNLIDQKAKQFNE